MILGILQARLSSSRLPGKVLRKIMGRTMLELQLERLGRCRKIDKLIVATSIAQEDHAIVNLCDQLKIEVFRGDPNDVLDRFYQAARKYKPENVVRLTGDCPLTDPDLIDELIEFYLIRDCDYASNSLEPTLPDGLDAEVFSFTALKHAWEEARLPSEREHATLYIYTHPELFKTACWRYSRNFSHLRWTVDEPEDYELICRIYEELYPANMSFTWKDVLALLEQRPELAEINTAYRRNEGLETSLEKDRQVME